MTYSTIEQEIVAQLLPIREELGVVVQGLPESPSLWASVAGNGWVVLRWESTQLEDYSLGEQSGIETLTYTLDVRVKSLRGFDSLYSVTNMLKSLLWGFKPTLCYRPITLNKIDFVGMAEDYWVATGTFVVYVYAGYSQQYIDPDTLTKVKDIEFMEAIS